MFLRGWMFFFFRWWKPAVVCYIGLVFPSQNFCSVGDICILVSPESKDSESVCQVKIVLGCYERNFMDGNLNMNLCVQYESRPQREAPTSDEWGFNPI